MSRKLKPDGWDTWSKDRQESYKAKIKSPEKLPDGHVCKTETKSSVKPQDGLNLTSIFEKVLSPNSDTYELAKFPTKKETIDRINRAENSFLKNNPRKHSQEFDNCFESGDGDEVMEGLIYRAQKNPILKQSMIDTWSGEWAYVEAFEKGLSVKKLEQLKEEVKKKNELVVEKLIKLEGNSIPLNEAYKESLSIISDKQVSRNQKIKAAVYYLDRVSSSDKNGNETVDKFFSDTFKADKSVCDKLIKGWGISNWKKP